MELYFIFFNMKIQISSLKMMKLSSKLYNNLVKSRNTGLNLFFPHMQRRIV